MRRTLIYILVFAFGALIFSVAAPGETKSGKAAVKKELKTTKAVQKKSAESGAKAEASAKPGEQAKSPQSKSSGSKSIKSGSTKAGVSVSPTTVPQSPPVGGMTDPEVGLSGVRTGEQINWQALSSGGGFSSSANFGILSAIGQPAVGVASSPSFNLNSGFVQNFSTSCCVNAGNANDDALGKVNIADVTFLIARIFAGGLAPPCCEQASANGDDKVNIADVTFLIARIFAGGVAPVCGPTGMTC